MKSFHRSFSLFAVLAALLLLTACSISLAQDVTPPPDYVPPQAPETQAPAQVVLPMVPPDPNAGAPIYVEKCLPCHGETGKGDGFQANNLSSPPPSIGAVENIRLSRPVDWFQMVTQGNMQNMMPGFSGSLDDRQRWDVVSYVYTFGMDPAQLEQGQAVFTAQCQSCHGANGEGSGKTPDWTDPAQLAQRSEEELRQVFTSGEGEHPSFADTMDEGQQWAVTGYIRSLSFANTQTAGQPAQLDATPSSETTASADATPAAGETSVVEGTPSADGTPAAQSAANVTGRVVNASGGELPQDLTVKLMGFDQMQQALELTTKAASDGNFVFENVELNADRVFLATVETNGLTFNSEMLRASDILSGQEARLNLHIYDTTTDTSSLTVDRMHVFFDFPEPGIVQVGELFILSNSSNLMVVSEKAGEGVVSFTLPEGANNLTFQEGVLGERYLQTDTGFTDTATIGPGSGSQQVLFAYELPYDGKIDVELTPPLPVTAAVIIAPASGVRLSSDQLSDSGVKDMQGVSVHLYTAGGLPAGAPLNVNLSGSVDGPTSLDSGTTTGLIVGGLSLLVSLGLTVYYFASRRKRLDEETVEEETDAPQTVDSLVEAIVALDDLYQSGQLPKEAYTERRAALKEQLRVARENGENVGK